MAIFLGKPTSENLISGMSVGAPTIIRPATPDPSKFNAFYIVYDRVLANYRLDFIQEIHPGDVITLKAGEDVAANYVGTEDENPDLTFQHWSCPLEQINGTITIPSRVDCDLYIGAVYVPTDGLDHWVYDQYGNNTRRYYGNTTTNLNYAEYENDYLKVVMPSATTRFTNPWLVYNLRMTTFIVPQGVTQLDRVFSTGGVTNIKYLVIPHGMTTLKGNPCLGGLRATHHVWLPDTITSIEAGAFASCAFSYFHVPKNLSGVLPQHFLWAPRVVVTRLVLDCPITSLDTYCIRSAYIGALYLPSTLESFAGSSFDTTRANVLVCTATTPPTAGGGFLTAAMKRVYVPVGTISAYENATNWSAHAGKFIEYTRANCEANGDEYIELR